MRKIAMILVVVMVMSALALPAFAAEPRFTTIVPGMSFNGTTANCSVKIAGNNVSEHLEASIKLWCGNTCVDSWEAEGYGYLYWSDTASVNHGSTYKLEVTLSVNGVPTTPVNVTKTCP